MPIDYKRYPPNWIREIRPRILERANHCCEECGLPNYSHVNKITRELCLPDEDDAIKIILTISHLDHDETNWDIKDDRLKALCQRCHLRYDAPEKARRRNEKKNINNLKLDL